jgi:hypothetical protein
VKPYSVARCPTVSTRPDLVRFEFPGHAQRQTVHGCLGHVVEQVAEVFIPVPRRRVDGQARALPERK